MLTIQNLSMGFGGRMLFENVTTKFGEGFRYGIVGANGCGKSTFMRILAGEQEPLSGSISLGNGERLAWLRQDQFAYEEHLVLDVVMMGHQEMWECQQKKDAIYANPDASEEDYLEASQLEARFAELGGYTAPAQAAILLQGVGIEADLHNKTMKAVPSGWKLRVLLAQALFANPDILLLDEPTNHLDLHTITWLEQTLNQKEGTILIISHDRHFLNEVCTHMVDVDYHTLTVYPGNYDDFMEAAALARQRQLSVQSRNKDRIAELEEFVRRFRAHKAKARQATSRMKQIEKLKVEDVKPSSRQYPFIRFSYPPKDKLYRQALQVSDLSFAYPGQPPLFKKFSLSVEAGEKIAIIGPNGRGKSTLLKLLSGELTPTSGQIRWSERAKFGVVPQEHGDLFNSEQTLIDWLTTYWTPNDSGMEPEQQMRSILGRLLFSGDEVKKSINVLSGGEQVKMLFGRLMLSQANVLLLDEPTNHLDMEAIEALNAALEQFPGTVLVASHDRELVSSLTQRVLAFTLEGLQDSDLESALSASALA